MNASTNLKGKRNHILRTIGIALSAFLLMNGVGEQKIIASTSPQQAVKWQIDVPTKTCTAASHTQCHRGSPVIADIDNDGRDDIVIVTHNGHIVALKDNGAGGQVIWDKDVAAAFGMTPGSEEINSSPAVADIDGDGRMEIVVGVGGMYPQKHCAAGGIIVLEHTGAVKAGWPHISNDELLPYGCPDTVYSTPALGDLDKDGDMEIVVGGFDRRIYAFNANGSYVPGFPVDSILHDRFGWSNLQGQLADTIWGSPALGDLDGDGYLDIVISTDEGNFDNRYAPVSSDNWDCPYARPPEINPGYCGGSLYAMDRFGRLLPGFPRHFLDTMQSSPALYDIDQDGRAEIFVGTGSYYYYNSTDHPTNEFKLYALNGFGEDLPGWGGGKTMAHIASASPVLGDIAGDADPEIIVGTMGGDLYAWHLNGTNVAGFPVKPETQYGNSSKFDVGKSFVLADYTNNGKMDILFTQEWVVNVVTGQGAQLTTNSFPQGNLMYFANGLLLNNPALGDIDGDGELEMIVQNSKLTVWDLPGVVDSQWPMFKQNAARSSELVLDAIAAEEKALFTMTQNPNNVQMVLHVSNPGENQIRWYATATDPRVTVQPATGWVTNETDSILITVTSVDPGINDLGEIVLTSNVDLPGSGKTVPVQVNIVDQLHSNYLPLINR